MELDYNARRRSLAKRFDAMQRGARLNCSFDVRVHPSRITDVLSGKHVSTIIMGLMERWCAVNESAWSKQKEGAK